MKTYKTAKIVKETNYYFWEIGNKIAYGYCKSLKDCKKEIDGYFDFIS